MQRILVMGRPGSGKSTLARAIGDKLGHQVIHLDNHFHTDTWERVTKDEWKQIQAELVKGQRWIIDGTYLSSSKPRLDRADTVVLLHIPRSVGIYRALRRYLKHRRSARPDLREGLKESITLRMMRKLLTFRMGKVVNTLKDYPHLKVIHLSSQKEVEAFLHSLKS